MTNEELNSYRFGSGQDPTDEMLSCIMREAAEEAAKSNKKAREAYFAALEKHTEEQRTLWAERINKVKACDNE